MIVMTSSVAVWCGRDVVGEGRNVRGEVVFCERASIASSIILSSSPTTVFPSSRLPSSDFTSIVKGIDGERVVMDGSRRLALTTSRIP